jgi:Spy/CpxP family protein refolding chaperone
MKNRSLIGAGLVIAVIIFLFAAMPVYAQKGDRGYRVKDRWNNQQEERYDYLAYKLGLSEEQAAQLKASKQEKIQTSKKLRDALSKQKEALKQELDKTDSDNARIKEIANAIKQIQADMVDERVKSILEIKAILTPEQYSELKTKLGTYKKRSDSKR